MNNLKSLINRIPAPYRAFVCAVAIVATLYVLMSVGQGIYRRVEQAAYTRAVAAQEQVVRDAEARSAKHEQTADEAKANFEDLEKQNTELNPRIVNLRKRANESITRADRARKRLYEIRKTPVDVSRTVDDVRRNELRANLKSLYPELE